MSEQLFRAVDLSTLKKDEASSEPVQYVGVYVLKWKPEWGAPTIGFVEVDDE